MVRVARGAATSGRPLLPLLPLLLLPLAWVALLGGAGCDLADLIGDHEAPAPNRVLSQLKVNTDQLGAIDNNVDAQLKALSSKILAAPVDDQTLESEPTDELLTDLDPQQRSIFHRAWQFATSKVAPAKRYVNLIWRYRTWYAEYDALRREALASGDETEATAKSALDLLRVEYAKLDAELYAESQSRPCKLPPAAPTSPGQAALLRDYHMDDEQFPDVNQYMTPEERSQVDSIDVESFDFVVRALNKLIGRLEERLAMVRERGFKSILAGFELDDRSAAAELARLEQDASIKEAFGRMKRIALRSAGRLAYQETRHIVKFVLLKSLATAIQNRERSGGRMEDTLALLEPVIMLLGDVDTPVLVTYLRDIRFRLIYGLVGSLDQWSKCNPLG